MASPHPPADQRWVTVGPDNRLPQAILDKLHEEFPETDAGLNVIGDGQFVIVPFDADSSEIPDGTFIARLPDGFTP